MSNLTSAPKGYTEWLGVLKSRIQSAQVRAALAVNSELVRLYWEIGRGILEKQQSEGWGAKVIDRLADDLRREFPEMKGFSPRNLKYMRAFAEAWPDEEFVQQVAAQLPWFHNCSVLDKVSDPEIRKWYLQQAREHGWSRNVLVIQIESRLYHRQGKAITNFANQLPSPQSDLAQQTLKDPYLFDFLSLGTEAKEREIEGALTTHITRFLLELGAGFSYVGKQMHLDVGGEDFYIDLLFYHLKLRCFVVIELKAGAFKPEYAGQLNFYLSAVDSQLKHHDDNPTIGLLLCKERNKLVAEYALRGVSQPIGIAEFQLVQSVPEEFSDALPSIEQLEAELGKDDND